MGEVTDVIGLRDLNLHNFRRTKRVWRRLLRHRAQACPAAPGRRNIPTRHHHSVKTSARRATAQLLATDQITEDYPGASGCEEELSEGTKKARDGGPALLGSLASEGLRHHKARPMMRVRRLDHRPIAMPTHPEVTLFTSIPPCLPRPFQGGRAWQTACIESWKASGFRIVSVNRADEISALRSLEASVAFTALPASRERALITVFFEAAAASGEVAGIINADCLLIPQIGLVKRLVEELDSLVIAERIGLSQTTLHPTGHVCQGFDAFFFATKALARLEIDDRRRALGTLGEVRW